jgi:hypothetical protein
MNKSLFRKNCEKDARTFSCDACKSSFCLKRVGEHRQELIFQMDDIENNDWRENDQNMTEWTL